jgi:hypothetical protein
LFQVQVVPGPGCSRSRSSQVIPGHPRSSQDPGHPRSSQVIPGHPRSSQVIPGHPRGRRFVPRPLWPVY